MNRRKQPRAAQAALKFTRAGLLLVPVLSGDIMDAKLGTSEFPQPLTEQEMFAFLEQEVPEEYIVLGYAAFAVGGFGTIYHADDAPAHVGAVIDRLLIAAFLPEQAVVLPVNQHDVEANQ